MLKIRLLVLGVTLILTPLVGRAECIALSAPAVIAQEDIKLVFRGRVETIDEVGQSGARVTFAVSRVWKGSVPEHFELYVWWTWPEVPSFAMGKDYVVFAQPMTAPEFREKLGIPSNTAAFRPAPCSDAVSVGTIERDLGAGYKPTTVAK
jgi:hypothetical protein